jgi:hypothetical protein
LQKGRRASLAGGGVAGEELVSLAGDFGDDAAEIDAVSAAST